MFHSSVSNITTNFYLKIYFPFHFYLILIINKHYRSFLWKKNRKKEEKLRIKNSETKYFFKNTSNAHRKWFRRETWMMMTIHAQMTSRQTYKWPTNSNPVSWIRLLSFWNETKIAPERQHVPDWSRGFDESNCEFTLK